LGEGDEQKDLPAPAGAALNRRPEP
jgi:hypothetical protein